MAGTFGLDRTRFPTPHGMRLRAETHEAKLGRALPQGLSIPCASKGAVFNYDYLLRALSHRR